MTSTPTTSYPSHLAVYSARQVEDIVNGAPFAGVHGFRHLFGPTSTPTVRPWDGTPRTNPLTGGNVPPFVPAVFGSSHVLHELVTDDGEFGSWAHPEEMHAAAGRLILFLTRTVGGRS